MLAAVAEQGFVGLGAAMAEVRTRVKDPRRRLRELGVAYVRYAPAHPSHFRIMFGADICDRTGHPSLHAAGDHAFGLLVTTITEAQRPGHVRRGDPEALAVAAWSLVHGLSALLIDRQLEDYVHTPRDSDRLAADVTKLLETGLRPPAARRG